ncbi:hypothetical protein PSHT_05738 [Puccinia striiformis]|uniref:Uncharacterized protein n=2 Tax=Puccinia striiformis TaxID=27350 RepID=A0A0L0VRL1_9BASI|nr:hypothetical protein PSTG_04972 [Puccinia striiformis f. sp. tritici PST-78]POW18498.1 hypothetical protein PSHT_05738 [Puccinia striiformis]
MAQVSTPTVEINSDWRSILLKAVTDALAKQIPLLIEKYFRYLAQTKSSKMFTLITLLAVMMLLIRILITQQQLLTENTELNAQLHLIRTHINQQSSFTNTEGGIPEVKAPLDLFISTLAGQGQPT